MYNTDFDVVIIGGGPAGSVAGINLAKSGVNTAIIERKSFPRETLCGEFLSSEVTSHLKELNLFEKFISLNPNKITCFRFITFNKIFNANLPFEGYSIKRSLFDQFLLNEAKESGVKVFQPAEVKDVQRDGKDFTLQIKLKGDLKNITGNFVVGAYGKSNILDKKLQRKFSHFHSGYTGIKFHLKKVLISDISDSTIYIFSGNNIYCGINTVSNDEATVCFLIKRNNSNELPKEQIRNLLNQNKIFSSLFRQNNINLSGQDIYGAGNIYFGRKSSSTNGIIMIGDAAGMIAPLTGDGIGMAFQSAKIASESILDFIKQNIDRRDVEKIYRLKWKKHFIKRILIARGIQNIVLNNYSDKIHSGIIRLLIPPLISATRN